MSECKRIPASEHGINPREIHKHARQILRALGKAGYEAYLVGGSVRDLLLDKHPKDFDIATNATPEEVKSVLPSTRIIGRRFRLAHVYFGRDFIEVATFRAPHDDTDKGIISDDGRIIHDNVFGTVEQDAVRRDFTINALFYELESGDVLDYVDGMSDLKSRTLRLIGDPKTRYQEDPVRMLRAIRFAAKLDCKIHENSRILIRQQARLLLNIAPARLFDETLKLFHGGAAVKTFHQLRDFGLFGYLFPGTEDSLNAASDNGVLKFIEVALQNTDKRIRAEMPVTPAFLFAVMLWRDVDDQAEDYRNDGNPYSQSVHLAANHVFAEQVRRIAIPKRFSIAAREMWVLQGRFRFKSCRKAYGLIEHIRFRAAYDFMCLRARAGEPLEEDCEWWTLFQEVDEAEQKAMCQPHNPPRRRRRKSSRK